MKRVLLLALAIAFAGCGPSEKDLVGTWTGKVQLEKPGTVQTALDAVTISIELNEDKTFKTLGFEGAWSYDGEKLTLTPTKTLGLNIASPASTMTAVVAKDARSFTLDAPFAQKGTFVFTKAN
jgi:hypothetical protein